MSTWNTLQRSFENLRGNWLLSLIMTLEAIGFTLAALLPLLPLIREIAAGPFEPDVVIETIEGWFDTAIESPLVIFQIVATLVGIALVALLVHIFLIGGVTRVLHEWEASVDRPRASLSEFLRACRVMFFPAFLLYNITWGLGLLAALIPALPLLAFVALEEDPARLVWIGASGLVLWLLFIAALMVLIRAITAVALGRLCHEPDNVVGSIHSALSAIAAHLGPFVKLTLATFLIGLVAGLVTGGLESGLSGKLAALGLLWEAVKWLAGAALSAAAGVWLLAAFIAFEHRIPDSGKAFATN